MCDTFVATPDFTASGHLIFGKNSDREPNEAQAIVRYPAAETDAPFVQATYIRIPQVPRTFEVLLSRPFHMWGGEMGVNERGVVIGNEAVFTRVGIDRKTPALTGMDLLRFALERSASATAAPETVTDLLERYGQDACGGYENRRMFYHNSFLIADPNEAYCLETAGRHWAALRVRGFRSISNGLTIESDYDRISGGCIDFARRRGWLKRGATFSFRGCFSDVFYTHLSGSRLRRERTTRAGLAARGRLTAAMAMDILRMEGDPDRTGPFHPARSDMGSICMHATGLFTPSQTAGSLVGEMRPAGPSTCWMTGTSIPSTAVFLPLTLPGTTLLDAGGRMPAARADDSLWWRHERLYRLCLTNYPSAVEAFRREQAELQDAFVRGERTLFDGGAPTAAALDAYSADCLTRVLEAYRAWHDRVAALRLKPAPRAPLYRRRWRRWNRRAGLSLPA
jgi:dipeptidase